MSAQQKPFAWAYRKKEDGYPTFSFDQEWPVGMVKEFGGEVIPLYRQPQPTLTDAEREALDKACDLADYAGFHSTTRAVLRGLLKRLGGEECTA